MNKGARDVVWIAVGTPSSCVSIYCGLSLLDRKIDVYLAFVRVFVFEQVGTLVPNAQDFS